MRNKIISLLYISLICVSASLYSAESAHSPCNQDTISPTLNVMDEATFKKIIVGNTIAGLTRQSKSLYLLYFDESGSCDLWKQDQVYSGSWWVEHDELGRDFVRAYWPNYTSSNPVSTFSPDNPSYGKPTSIWYYIDSKDPSIICVATSKFWAPVVLVSGNAIPSFESEES